jgi:hypothetical protein
MSTSLDNRALNVITCRNLICRNDDNRLYDAMTCSFVIYLFIYFKASLLAFSSLTLRVGEDESYGTSNMNM